MTEDTWTFPILKPSDARKPHASYDWLVGNSLLPKGSRAITVGPKSSGKTGVIVDLLFFRSVGDDWHGTPITMGRSVLVLGEGINGVRKRIRALEKYHKKRIPDDRLLIVNYGVPIDDGRALQGLIRTIDAYFGKNYPPDLIVFDTLSMCLGRADESSNTQMRMMYRELDVLRDTYGCTTMPLTHTGHNIDSGHARGASVLEDDAETVLKIEGLTEKKSRLSVRKQKEEDAENIPVMIFRREPVTLDTKDNMGALETSYVLVTSTYTTPAQQQTKSDIEMMLDLLENASTRNNTNYQAVCRDHGIGQRKYETARDTLLRTGRIVCTEGDKGAHLYALSDLEILNRAKQAGQLNQNDIPEENTEDMFLHDGVPEEINTYWKVGHN